jgi:hypothetical protein
VTARTQYVLDVVGAFALGLMLAWFAAIGF